MANHNSRVLIGFIGGLIFYVVDPLRTQTFRWKGVLNIGGAAAIGAAFMYLAHTLTTQNPAQTLDNLKVVAQELQIRVNNELERSITAKVSAAELIIEVSNYPPRERASIQDKLLKLSDSQFKRMIVFTPPIFKVFLMDSTLPEVTYNEGGESNGTVLMSVLRDIRGIQTIPYTTNPGWDFHQQVFEVNPDLVVIHFSCFQEHTRQPADVENLDKDPFSAFLKYMGSTKTKFLVYSRAFGGHEEKMEKTHQALDPRLKGRVKFFHVSDHRFKEPTVRARFKQAIKDMLRIS